MITLLLPGCSVDVPEYPFDEQYDSFAFNSLLTRQESIQAIGLVGTECNKVAAMSLFHIPTAKHMRLEEFEQTQSQATSHVSPSKIILMNFVRVKTFVISSSAFSWQCDCSLVPAGDPVSVKRSAMFEFYFI